MTANDRRALLIVDVQNDFCEGGSMGVDGGADCAARINRYLTDRGSDYTTTFASADWHIDPGEHFASSNGSEPDFVGTWPDHCVAGTSGAEFHANFTAPVDHIVWKGQYASGYSAFEGVDEVGKGLVDLLEADQVDTLDVCGIATSHCVRASTEDALRDGRMVRVLSELTVGVTPEMRSDALEELASQGATIV